MKKTIEDYGKNLDRIKKKLPAEREELSRERIELQDGKMCDLVAYDVKAYGYVEYAENIEQSNGDFRRTRSLIPFNYLDANMSKFRWDIYGVDVKLQQGIAQSFVEQFKKYQKAGKGLYIYSKTKGSGKTLLACSLANGVMEHLDICVKFVSVPELLEMTKKSYKDFLEKEDIERIRTAELLILDDIGAEIKKEWVDTELFRLIDYRYSNQRVTIFTSNISMNNLKLNERIVDRIFSMCIKLDLPEKSIRTMQAHDENMEFLRNIMKNAPDGAGTPSQGNETR